MHAVPNSAFKIAMYTENSQDILEQLAEHFSQISDQESGARRADLDERVDHILYVKHLYQRR